MISTCCPDGYIYNLSTNQCIGPIDKSNPVPCPCCPAGSTWVNGQGYFVNMFTGAIQLIDISNFAQNINCCNTFIGTSNVPAGVSNDPVDCVCCPEGYTYNQATGFCTNGNNSQLSTIPCLSCNCDTVPDPMCPTCGTSGLAVSYSWDFTKTACTICTPQDINNPPGAIQSFLPEQFLDPVLSTFVLKNKNFI